MDDTLRGWLVECIEEPVGLLGGNDGLDFVQVELEVLVESPKANVEETVARGGLDRIPGP